MEQESNEVDEQPSTSVVNDGERDINVQLIRVVEPTAKEIKLLKSRHPICKRKQFSTDVLQPVQVESVHDSLSGDSDNASNPLKKLKKFETCDKSEGYETRMDESDTKYQIKWIIHHGRKCPIITQNRNGPCPLIAVVNVLSIKSKIQLSEDRHEISEDELMKMVYNALMDKMPQDSENDPDQLQNVQDAVALLPLLRSGLNVNIKFNGVKNFEYTRECLIFDILGIHLYHGWIMDPQSSEVASAICGRSYNQLVEHIIHYKTSSDPEKVAEALTAEYFLETTASQLTTHGLQELNSSIENEDIAVLFRNNHFIVLYKHDETLYQLVTDQGFLEEPDVVWETLSNINGDETFVDCKFTNSLVKEPTTSVSPSEEEQISQDFLVALSLQDEQNKHQDKEFGWDAYGNALGAIGMTSDEELARLLHIEEQRMAQTGPSTPASSEGLIEPTGSPPTHPQQSTSDKEHEEPSRSREWKCIVS